MSYPTLNEVFPDWLTTGGIFTVLQEYDVPWKTDGIASELDLYYHGNISGDKLISPLVDKIRTGSTLSSTEQEMLATAIMALFSANWGKLWATMELEYNPIQNYSMVEQMTNDRTVTAYGKTRTRTDNLSHTKTGTETDAPNTTETETPNITNDTDTEVYGFNSSNAVPSGGETRHATGTNTVTRTGQEQLTYNTTDADSGTQTNNDGGQDTSTRNYSLTRSGNIGVTTSQQMIESERNLWVWNFFTDVVFPDIDRALTLQIY